MEIPTANNLARSINDGNGLCVVRFYLPWLFTYRCFRDCYVKVSSGTQGLFHFQYHLNLMLISSKSRHYSRICVRVTVLLSYAVLLIVVVELVAIKFGVKNRIACTWFDTYFLFSPVSLAIRKSERLRLGDILTMIALFRLYRIAEPSFDVAQKIILSMQPTCIFSMDNSSDSSVKTRNPARIAGE